MGWCTCTLCLDILSGLVLHRHSASQPIHVTPSPTTVHTIRCVYVSVRHHTPVIVRILIAIVFPRTTIADVDATIAIEPSRRERQTVAMLTQFYPDT